MTQPNYVVNQPRVLSSTEQDVLRKNLMLLLIAKISLVLKLIENLASHYKRF